jgi:hypothetical protein
MNYYVICKEQGHEDEKVYITNALPDPKPRVRAEIHSDLYQITCPRTGRIYLYSKMDIKAEADLTSAFIGGGVAGLLLALVDPLIGIAGGVSGFSALAAAEERKVKEFNESVG